MIAVKSCLFTSLISSPSDLEVVCIKIDIGSDTLVICCVYVPPDSSLSYVSSLVKFLSEITSSFSCCIILGDFNFPDIDWSVLMGTSHQSNCFCNFVFDCNLTQHVPDPTHVKGNLLDLVLTSPSVSINSLTVHPSSVIDFSDHFAVSFSVCCNVSSGALSSPGYVFDFCNADYESITNHLLDSDFSIVFDSSNIEFVWLCIKSLIYNAMLLYVPKILVKRHQGPKWFNSDIRHHLKCLRSTKRKFTRHPTEHRESKIHQMESLLQLKLSQAKSKYENKLIESQSSNPSAIYSYIRSISHENDLPSTLYLDHTSAVCDADKATLFNQFFFSVFTRSLFQLPPLTITSSSLCEICFSELDVFRVLQSLDVSKAMGCDGISPRLLKHSALALYQPFYHLFQLSLSQSYLPFEWRTHLIKPTFKSGDRNSVRNYRPISLLSVVSKVLEKLVYNSIVDYTSTSISSCQFGFLRGRSTLQQLLIFFNILHNSSSQIDVVYLDFRKAFDSVAHNELLLKLWNFGINGKLWSWMKAYLTDRLQYVSVGHSTSSTLPVLSGVPQGSILGPLLFLIFVNDMPDTAWFSKILLFADDAKCIMPISSPLDSTYLQSDLLRLSQWCTTWNLYLNENKCSIVHFKARPSSTFNYHLNYQQITSSDKEKDLGLVVSADLNWQSHYQLISSKAYKILGLLRRVFSNSILLSAKLSLYISLVRSQLLYCSPVWHPYLLKDIRALELVQRRATKFIVNNNDMDYRNRFLSLKLLPLMMEYEIADIMFLVKCLKSSSDHFNICDFVEFCAHSTRGSSSLKLKHKLCRTHLDRNFYFNRIPRLWNSLPTLDINLPLPAIKSRLRQFFWDQFMSKFDSNNTCSFHYLCPCPRCSHNPVNMHFSHSLV